MMLSFCESAHTDLSSLPSLLDRFSSCCLRSSQILQKDDDEDTKKEGEGDAEGKEGDDDETESTQVPKDQNGETCFSGDDASAPRDRGYADRDALPAPLLLSPVPRAWRRVKSRQRELRHEVGNLC